MTRIDVLGRTLRLETETGAIETELCIVTVPTNVLAAGAIGFGSGLDGHLQAAANLPLGVADKLFFHLDAAAEIPPDTRLIGAPGRRDAGSYTLRSNGRPLVEGYFGGDHARALEKGGLAAFAAAAREEITAVMGANIGRRLTPLVATAWAHDPFAMGSYSHALPGHADDRAVLATPFEDRLVFAGEATSKNLLLDRARRLRGGHAGRSLGGRRPRHACSGLARFSAAPGFFSRCSAHRRLPSCIAAFGENRLRSGHAS